eukprot:gnl/MRDRNA2_/MRDRNA2_76674_c0_seq2.p1 gnl/MRDRNA2_/MRDRNA2_76674_c0~~gnl/MRDRNA2_/MRDRNA2_76674_c0_seq2.p1  ORF type:complete len:145 (+),score=10.10 gnl/MRDRNA2_/MRDRNA2_76674_c0_seq2:959-1393(+)
MQVYPMYNPKNLAFTNIHRMRRLVVCHMCFGFCGGAVKPDPLLCQPQFCQILKVQSYRLCFWKAHECSGVICRHTDSTGEHVLCELRRFFDGAQRSLSWMLNQVGNGQFYRKRLDMECSPFLQWRSPPAYLNQSERGMKKKKPP